MNMFTVLLAILVDAKKKHQLSSSIQTDGSVNAKAATKEVIVECCSENESIIKSMGTIKHRLPMINSYVVEIPEYNIKKIDGLEGITAVHQNAHITAQMDKTRQLIKSEDVRFTGKGVTIAILDTGLSPVNDFLQPTNRILAFKDFINSKSNAYDDNGHGTHVAGIAAGNGNMSCGKYCGIAPDSNIIAVKVLDKKGQGNSASVLAGLQWVIDNKEKYNIRIANLSVGASGKEGKDPLIKAVNKLWDSGVVMTIAAGNNGPAKSSITSPGISRKVITVGSSDDDKNSVFIWGSALENFSGRGPTEECIIKPDVIAPGCNIVSCLSKTQYFASSKDKSKVIDGNYIQMSGTSMSTPIVTGAIALLLEKEPHLTPNDIKLRLKEGTTDLKYPQNRQGWGMINIQKFLAHNH